MPEGFRVLDSFSVDITLAVLKIVNLYQNKRFQERKRRTDWCRSRRSSCQPRPRGTLKNSSSSSELPKLVLFASCRRYISGEFDKDIKTLVKKGRDIIGKDMEQALDIASNIGASVIDGAACCGKYVKDDLENPTLFDEWLIECERMFEAMGSLKNFDESTGEDE